MYKLSKKQEKITLIGYGLLWAMVAFIGVFFMSQFVLTAVYGEIPNSYHQTVLITQNASNHTNGMMIDDYIDMVKLDICKTIPNNETAYLECMNL